MINEWGIDVPEENIKENIDEKKPKSSKRNVFEVCASVYKKDFFATDEDLTVLNEHFFCSILSNHPSTIFLAQKINESKMDIRTMYNFVYYSIPPNVLSYIGYPSKKKVSSTDSDVIKRIAKHYKCNIMLATRYHKMLPKEISLKIYNMYSEGGFETKPLRKKRPKKSKK